MMKVLIGSQALLMHKIDLKKEPRDWDFLNDSIVEGDGADTLLLDFESTNLPIYNICQENPQVVQTPYGEAILAPLYILVQLYGVTAEYNKQDEEFLNLCPDYWTIQNSINNKTRFILESIFKIRRQETDDRNTSQLVKFFNVDVPRLFPHDYLHDVLSKSMASEPSYKKILNNHATQGSIDLFKALSQEEKLMVVYEELVIFTLERNLIPQIVACPCFAEAAFKEAVEISDIYSPAYYWLYRFAKIGGVKKTPKWLSEWIQSNFKEIKELVKEKWEKTFLALPESFWVEVLEQAKIKTT